MYVIKPSFDFCVCEHTLKRMNVYVFTPLCCDFYMLFSLPIRDLSTFLRDLEPWSRLENLQLKSADFFPFISDFSSVFYFFLDFRFNTFNKKKTVLSLHDYGYT